MLLSSTPALNPACKALIAFCCAYSVWAAFERLRGRQCQTTELKRHAVITRTLYLPSCEIGTPNIVLETLTVPSLKNSMLQPFGVVACQLPTSAAERSKRHALTSRALASNYRGSTYQATPPKRKAIVEACEEQVLRHVGTSVEYSSRPSD